MEKYQETYIANLKKIYTANDVNIKIDAPFEEWYSFRKESEEKMQTLKAENNALINKELFPVLDDLFNADDLKIENLKQFASVLMDWSSNLDVGVYVKIGRAHV